MAHVIARSRLTSKEQLSLPSSIRRLLGVAAGDELVWMRGADGRVVVEAARSQSLADIRSAVSRLGPVRGKRPVSVRDMKRALAGHVKARHGGG